MSNDNTPGTGEGVGPEPLPDFESTPWHAMIGVRSNEKGDADIRMVVTPLGAVERAGGGISFDRTIHAVYFADWFNRNKELLWRAAMHEHALYCNLKRATENIGRASPLRLLDQDGQRLN